MQKGHKKLKVGNFLKRALLSKFLLHGHFLSTNSEVKVWSKFGENADFGQDSLELALCKWRQSIRRPLFPLKEVESASSERPFMVNVCGRVEKGENVQSHIGSTFKSQSVHLQW